MSDKLTIRQNFDSLQALETAEKFINKLSDSSLLSKFKVKNDDGNIVTSTGNAIAAMVLGAKMGLDPITSLSIGNELQGSKVYAVDKGVAMGLTPLEAIKQIHVITNNRGENTIFVGINIISRQLLKAGVTTEILKDCEPIYSYKVKVGKNKDAKFVPIETDRIEDSNGNILDKYFLVDPTITQEEVDQANAVGKIFIQRYISDYETKVRMIRKNPKIDISLSYKKSQAIAAGLVEVKNSKGEIVQKGKSNWNMYFKQMMRNRPISELGRIIAADYINGVYEFSEIPADVEDVEYQEE